MALMCASGVAEDYNYDNIVRDYCHTSLDWGAIPERPEGATGLRQLQVFIRHGARVLGGDDFCWAGGDDPSNGNFSCALNYLENSIGSSGKALTPFFRKTFMTEDSGIWGSCEVGQLVEAGFQMEHSNGQRLREAYIHREGFLPASLGSLSSEEIDRDFFIRSTNVHRTRQSGMALVSGMYEGKGPLEVPYMTLKSMDLSRETMLVNKNICPSIVDREASFFDQLGPSDAAAALGLCTKFNPGITRMKDCFWWLAHLVDCLMSRMCPNVPFSTHKRSIPEAFLADDSAMVKSVWKVIDTMQLQYFKAMVHAGASSAFVGSILSAAEAALAKSGEGGVEPKKFLLYSGHDTGPMLPLYAAFDLHPEAPYWPSFASMLVLELWDTADGPVVRWISNGKVAVGPMPFEDFRKQASRVTAKASSCTEGIDAGVISSSASLSVNLPPKMSRFAASVRPLSFAAVALTWVAAAAFVAHRRRRAPRQFSLLVAVDKESDRGVSERSEG